MGVVWGGLREGGEGWVESGCVEKVERGIKREGEEDGERNRR